ncbi:MAG: hypothetical protein QNJ97_16950 [Myxococcota bacterium]|nr:hypothetical protein [Myxococcota bacterium]
MIVFCVLLGCGGKETNHPTPPSEPQAEKGALETTAEKDLSKSDSDARVLTQPKARPSMAESTGGEMLPGLALPRKQPWQSDAAPAELPNMNELVQMARNALDKGALTEALAIIDVLVITYPGEPEFLEMRGDALIGQGNREDGMADLDRCCGMGRQSCCR